jgi:hypothetical protein
MNPEAKDYLSLFAEIAIATVALSGIIMVLAVSGKQISRQRVAQIATQLRMALIAAVFALLPLLITNFDLLSSAIWRICSALYLATMLYLAISSARGKDTYGQSLDKKGRLAVIVVGIPALTLMSLNLWLGTPWPYLVQLTIVLIISMLLFLDFIVHILVESTEQPDQ